MKKTVLIFLSLAISAITFAQGKYGKTPKDSVTCIENLIYKDYMKNEPKLALDMWRICYNTCPQSQKSLYTNGVKLFKNLAKNEKDPAKQKAYLDTLFSIYDQRIEMFGQKCLVLGQKGQTMLSTKQDKEKTFNTLNEAVELCGNKTQAGTLVALMFAAINLEKAGKKTKEEVVEVYEKTMAICAANKDKPKGAERYKKAEVKIGNVSSTYLDCAVLVPMAQKNFEANKADLAWLKRTMRLLKMKKCMKEPIYARVTETYIGLEPSASGYDGLANIANYNKEYNKAIGFYKKALELAETDEDKADYSFSLAKTYAYSKQYAQARSSALKAASLKKGWGEPYILIGDLYAQSSKTCDDGAKGVGKYGVYWAAVDKYKKAKAVDGSIAGVANKKIASISAHFPTTKDIFFLGSKDGDSYQLKCWINEPTTIRTKK